MAWRRAAWALAAAGGVAAAAACHPSGAEGMRMGPPGVECVARSAPGRIAVDGGAAATLAPAPGGPGVEGGRRLVLLLDDLRAERGSGAVFEVRLDGRALGTLNFFGARPAGAGGAPRRVSFDVPAPPRAGPLLLELRPMGPPEAPAGLSLGGALLAAQ